MSASFRILVAAVVLCALSGCVAHQRKHSVVRLWADWNTYAQCSLCMEELDHKPLRAARVGAFTWAYDKDPGHQAAYSKGRREWEALVAQRLQEATDAANGVGPAVSSPSTFPAATDALSTDPPVLDQNLPPLPSNSSTGELPGFQPQPNAPAETPAIPEWNDLQGGLPGASQRVPLEPASPYRLPADLPEDPPGIPADGPIGSAEPAFRLSGYIAASQQRATSASPRAAASRRPAGAWLFGRP